YLPPGVPHHGIAEGKCLTFSIGMRAPAKAELLGDLADFLAEQMGEDERYGDGDLQPARSAGEIDDAALKRLRIALSPFRDMDASLLRRWFGQFMTRYRAANLASPRARPLTASQWQRTRGEGHELLRNPWSRFAWSKAPTGATLFVAGDEFDCSRQLAEKLCARSVLPIGSLGKLSARDDMTLLALVNGGHLVIRKILKRRTTR
ncbi:MAG: winged helix domain-containing protein, partial [Dokdonella sp.]